MVDREKVIKALECCAAGCVNGCPYADEPAHCTDYLAKDALELLKDGEHPDFSGSFLNRDDYVRIGDVMDCLSKVFIPKDDLIHIEGLIEWAMGKRAISKEELLKAQEPRKHGQWIDIPDKPDWDQKMCSVCGEYFCCQLNYCPNCGAKMDKEE